jgi:hypothetical protein
MTLTDAQPNEMLRRLEAYWRSKRPGAGRLPSRAEIDPIDWRFALGLLVLVDAERGEAGVRFRHRLIGTHVVERAGYDATGRYLNEIPHTSPNTPRRHIGKRSRPAPRSGKASTQSSTGGRPKPKSSVCRWRATGH